MAVAFRLALDERVEPGLRRVVIECVDEAIDALHGADGDPHRAVHTVRKRLKEIRAALRLVRPALGKAYKVEHARYRDIGRRLSSMRDAAALVESFERLAERSGEALGEARVRTVRQQLRARRDALADSAADTREAVAETLEALTEARRVAGQLSLSDDGYDALGPGLKRNYREGRKALQAAYDDGTAEAFHDWRKRVKDRWYQLRLLEELWPSVLREARKEAGALADLLGDAQDLAVLHATLCAEPERFGDHDQVAPVLAVVEARRAWLLAVAQPLGRRLYADKPKALHRRFGVYWRAGRDEIRLLAERAAANVADDVAPRAVQALTGQAVAADAACEADT